MSDLSVSNLPEIYELVIIDKKPLRDVNFDEDGNVIGILNVIEFSIHTKNGNDPVDITADTRNYEIVGLEWSEVVISKRAITVVGSSYDERYDGEEHCFDEWNTLTTDGKYRLGEGHYFELTDDRTSAKEITIDGNGNIIGVPNVVSFVIRDEDGNDVTGNYEVLEEQWGTITVRPRKIKIETGSQRWLYDGEAHSYESFEIVERELIEGHELRIASGEDAVTYITEAGYVSNVLKLEVVDRNGNVVSAYDIEFEYGTLIVPWAVHVYLGRNEYIYDATAKGIASGTMIGKPEGSPNGSDVRFVFNGVDFTCTDVTTIYASDEHLTGMNSLVNFTMYDENGEDITEFYYVVVDAYAKEVSEYGKISNDYVVFQISPREIEITTKSAEKTYDGTPLVCKEYEVTNGKLADGDYFSEKNVDLMISEAISKGDKVQNLIQIEDFIIFNSEGKVVYDGKESTNNYKITWKRGTLEII